MKLPGRVLFFTSVLSGLFAPASHSAVDWQGKRVCSGAWVGKVTAGGRITFDLIIKDNMVDGTVTTAGNGNSDYRDTPVTGKMAAGLLTLQIPSVAFGYVEAAANGNVLAGNITMGRGTSIDFTATCQPSK